MFSGLLGKQDSISLSQLGILHRDSETTLSPKTASRFNNAIGPDPKKKIRLPQREPYFLLRFKLADRLRIGPHISNFRCSLQGLSLSFTVSTRCFRAGTSISTLFRPTRVDTGAVLRSFVSPSLARGLAIPWVEVGLVLPSVPIFIDPDLSAGFTKHLRLGWMQTSDNGQITLTQP